MIKYNPINPVIPNKTLTKKPKKKNLLKNPIKKPH